MVLFAVFLLLVILFAVTRYVNSDLIGEVCCFILVFVFGMTVVDTVSVKIIHSIRT